jgi:hypothetical protein
MAIVGNTVRLTAEFKTFNDVYSNPTDITLKIYNKRNIQVGDTISITAEHKKKNAPANLWVAWG